MMFALLALAAATGGTPVVHTEPCRRTAVEPVTTGQSIGPRRLGTMPPARQVLAVHRSVDGCPTPVVVRDQVGANGR